MRVKPLGLFTTSKFASYDWLFPEPPGISKYGSDLKITWGQLRKN